MYLGDFVPGDTIDFKFTTVGTTGAPTQLAGSPVLSVYKGNNTTETTTGPTLTADFDSRTGLNHVRLATSDGFYVAAENYQVVITTGTVGGTSVVGYVVAQFSLTARSALRPTTAGRTLTIETDGMAHADVKEVAGTTQTARDLGAQLDATVASRSSHSAADVWTSGTRTLSAFGFSVTVGTNSDKTGYALSSAGVQAIWDALTSALSTVGSVGKKLADWALGSDNKALLSNNAHTGAVVPTVTAVTNDVGITQAGADKVWSSAARTLTSFGTLIADIWAAIVDSTGVTTLLSRLSATRATNLDTIPAIEVDTQDIQARLPAALSAAGNLKADVRAVNNVTLTGDGAATPWGPV